MTKISTQSPGASRAQTAPAAPTTASTTSAAKALWGATHLPSARDVFNAASDAIDRAVGLDTKGPKPVTMGPVDPAAYARMDAKVSALDVPTPLDAATRARLDRGEIVSTATPRPDGSIEEKTMGVVNVPLEQFLARLPARDWGKNLVDFMGGEVKSDGPGRQIERMVLRMPGRDLDMTKIETLTDDRDASGRSRCSLPSCRRRSRTPRPGSCSRTTSPVPSSITASSLAPDGSRSPPSIVDLRSRRAGRSVITEAATRDPLGRTTGGSMRSFALLGAVLLIAPLARAAGVPLVRDGKPVAAIVVRASALSAAPFDLAAPAKNTADTKVLFAAKELQRAVEKMSGARLELLADSAPRRGPAVLVGASARTQGLKGLQVPSGLTPERKDEGYVLETRGDTLLVLGNDEGPYEGTFDAVAELLHRLGVRWFMPGEVGEVIPSARTLALPEVHVLERPAFRLRTWWSNQPADLHRDENLWKLRNHLQLDGTAIVAVPGDSYLRQYLPDPKLAETTPELFATGPTGKPVPTLPNLTNPAAADAVADKLIARFQDARAKGAPLDFLGFAPDDGLPIDLTPKTLAAWHLGFPAWEGREGVLAEESISEEWFRFVNRVAMRVTAAEPGVLLTTNGYANRSLPPEGVSLNPSLGVMTAQIWADTLKPYDDPKSWQSQVQAAELRRWAALTPRVFLYEYNATMLVTALTPVPQLHKLSKNYALLKKWGVIGFFNETTTAWMQDGLATRWLRARLMWNPALDVDAALKDWSERWYGPAATPSLAFWTALERAVLETPLLGHEDRILPFVYDDALIATLEARCAEAEGLATAEPFATRVLIDRLTLQHLEAYLTAATAEADGRYADAALALETMIELRRRLTAISPVLVLPPSRKPPESYYSSEVYWNVEDRRDALRSLAARTDGSKGELVAMAPKAVLATLDPVARGKSLGWYAPTFDHSGWATVDTTRPFYLQLPGAWSADGVPYVGHLWYRLELDVPKSAAGKTLHLVTPSVSAEAWAWVNGAFAGHRKYLEPYVRPNGLDLDVTRLVKPGEKNVIALWVSTGANRASAAEGLLGRVFLTAERAARDAGP